MKAVEQKRALEDSRVAELEEMVARLSAELSAARSEADAAARAVGHVSDHAAEVAGHLARTGEALQKTREELARQRVEVDRRGETIDALHRDLARLLSSTSIRVTAPLRMVMSVPARLVRRLRDLARTVASLAAPDGARRRRLHRTARAIERAGLFDEACYLAQNPEIEGTGLGPLEHYLEIGVAEGLNPHPFFDTLYYLHRYPEVAESGENPLLHYAEEGARFGYDPSPRFSTSYYVARYPDVLASGLHPLTHYMRVGLRESRRRVPDPNGGFEPEPPRDPFECWLGVNRWNPAVERRLRERLAAASGLPKLSVVMPVYDPPLEMFRKALESVREQVYENWELCIADDGSTEPSVRAFLGELERDPRVKLVRRAVNGGISAATNSAAALATGEFLVFLDQDDRLSRDALAEAALAIAGEPEADLVYSDTDKLDGKGKRYHPDFKPDWSPELLLGYMYCGQILVVRRSLFEQVGGMRLGFEGSQDHDLALRVTEHARRVVHLPKILYHWRAHPGSTALSAAEKPQSVEAGRRAVQEALERRGSRGIAVQPNWARRNGNSLFVHEFPDDGPSVTIVIPTKNRIALLDLCLRSLRVTTYRNYRVLVVDNESDEPEAIRYLEGLEHDVIRVANPPGGFNFAHLCNRAAEHARSDYVLFLNNDTEVLEPKWLGRMMGYAQLDGVGATGALLRFPDGRIQHAGVVRGYHDGAVGHAFKLLPPGDRGYLAHAAVARNCSAVTAACMLTPRRLFLDVGGFDEERFGVAFNDPDYCSRLLEKGWRTVYCPGAELRHHEGASRGFRDDPREEAEYRRRYEGRRDPYYNPNLSLDDELFRVRPRHVALGPRRPLRALLVTHNLNHEGAPRILFEVAAFLKDEEGLDPVVLSPSEGPMRREFEGRGIEVRVVEGPLWRPDGSVALGLDPETYEEKLRAWMDLVRSLRADVVWANTLTSFYAVDAADRLGLPSIWTIHESEGWETYFGFLSPLVARRALECFRLPYRVVFVARATHERYADLNGRHNFEVIHNGIDRRPIEEAKRGLPRETAREKLGIAPGETALLSIGTICPRKGQEDLVSALERMEASELSRLRVFLVGGQSDPYCRKLLKRVAGFPPGLRDRIHFVEPTPETSLYYRAADVFVMTSHVESYPLVVLEAMAYELPIVTTPVFGIAEQVAGDVNASIYEPGDVAALRDAILDLVHDGEKRRRYAEMATPALERRSSLRGMCLRYAEILQEASCTRDPGKGRASVLP